jgi:ribonuclease HI
MEMGYLDSVDAEAFAALSATRLCKDLGLDQIHFVGDAKVVVDAVMSGEHDESRRGLLTDGLWIALKIFSRWKIKHES